MLDEKTKALIKEHIDLHLNTAEAVLKGFETATTVNISDGAGWNFPITRGSRTASGGAAIIALAGSLKMDYDAVQFDTDRSILRRNR